MNKSIRAKVAFKYLVCALLITGATACDKEGFVYDNITDENSTEFLVTDTITMNMSTAYLDSIPTSNLEVALCGVNVDPFFGKMSASSFWQVRAFSGTAIPDRAIFDSMVLLVHPKLEYYGDTTLTQHIEVYRVQEEIKSNGNSPFMNSNMSFATDPTPLASKQMRIRPHRDTIFKLRMPDALGKEFFDLCDKNSQTITNQQLFNRFFKGLALKPGANSQVITSFRADDSLNLRMFYHSGAGEIVQAYNDFAVYNPSLQFSHIDIERPTGSPLATLSRTNRLLPSTSADNRLFVQPLTNIIGRIDFPYLRTFNQLSQFSKIMRATLTIRPERSTYSYPFNLPSNLVLGIINSGNQIEDTLASPATGAVQYGGLVLDKIFNESTAYTYDITNYCIAQLNSTDNSSRGLAILPPRSTGLSNFDRAILGDSKNKKNRITVQIYYLRYK